MKQSIFLIIFYCLEFQFLQSPLPPSSPSPQIHTGQTSTSGLTHGSRNKGDIIESGVNSALNAPGGGEVQESSSTFEMGLNGSTLTK